MQIPSNESIFVIIIMLIIAPYKLNNHKYLITHCLIFPAARIPVNYQENVQVIIM